VKKCRAGYIRRMQFGTFKLRVFENRVLREYLKLRGRKWRDNEELHNLYASSNIIGLIKSRRMRCNTHGRDKKCVQNFRRKTEGKRPLGRPRAG
jgi:hypothetical protein